MSVVALPLFWQSPENGLPERYRPVLFSVSIEPGVARYGHCLTEAHFMEWVREKDGWQMVPWETGKVLWWAEMPVPPEDPQIVKEAECDIDE